MLRQLVFNYGSNGTAQLRARVENGALATSPAHIEDFARVFCLKSRDLAAGGWGGGVASLSPCAGTNAYGSVAWLSPSELALLDG